MSVVKVPMEFEILSTLRAEGPNPELEQELALFGRFIGVWDIEMECFDAHGKSIVRGPGTWAWSWVLEGRAIQDVIVYSDPGDAEQRRRGLRRTGTTLRYFHAREGWRVVYLGATSGLLVLMRAQPVDDEIWMQGGEGAFALLRWKFTDIRADSFRWIGLVSDDDGRTWRREQEMWARRRK